ncbi:1,4-dihydroxy-6-naphthoate synthase [bacterium]|nr:MAG: 1,4-dihydroxy-6-naphthoate synthase [bacterium]
MTTLTVGYSTCPNDTFIFDAMIHGKIDTEDLRFEPELADVENLNMRAFKQELDISKLSYHAYLFLRDQYALLNSGSALGRNCGPLLISKKVVNIKNLTPAHIGIPGKYTTANLLLQLYLRKKIDAKIFLFSDIETALINGEIEAGVIIHENRFTYEAKGLKRIQDLGEFWESQTKLPIPLGGIVVKKQFSVDLQQKIDRILKRSVQFAFDNPESSREYVRKHAQEMSDDVMLSHIALYVNNYTLDLGKTGHTAVERLLTVSSDIL